MTGSTRAVGESGGPGESREEQQLMRTLRIDPRLIGRRLQRVGIDGNTVFLQPSRTDAVELWSLHTLFPESWQKLCSIATDEILYSMPCCSYHSPHLYVLIVAVFKGEEYPRISLFEVNRESKELKEYRLDESAGTEFESVHLENAILGCGPTNLHIYDRSIVMGPIPYWKLVLLESTFIVERRDIPDDSEEKCSRFPIAFEPDAGVFARLRDDHSLVVSSRDNSQWRRYVQAAEDRVDLGMLATRGLHETYGRAGHRLGAVESPLTIYSDGPVTVAKVTRDKRHFYYRILLDHDRREFRCVPSGSAVFSGGVDRMFYSLVGERIVVVVGIRGVAVAQMQPASLAESAVWSLQRHFCKADGNGHRSGGLTKEIINKHCGFRPDRVIV